MTKDIFKKSCKVVFDVCKDLKKEMGITIIIFSLFLAGGIV